MLEETPLIRMRWQYCGASSSSVGYTPQRSCMISGIRNFALDLCFPPPREIKYKHLRINVIVELRKNRQTRTLLDFRDLV